MRRDIQTLAIAATASFALAGCGFFDRHFHKENEAYKASVQEHPLEVPPDLDKPNTSGALTMPDAGASTATASAAASDASAPPAA